jgi:hypothetical protein
MSEVPTLCLDHLTPAQARAFMIAENKLVENADWDLRIQSLEEVGDRVDDPADALPEVLAGPASLRSYWRCRISI